MPTTKQQKLMKEILKQLLNKNNPCFECEIETLSPADANFSSYKHSS